ncbi:PREDICTED: zinc finger CCCH domain-containing protein 13-like isoform X2 [Vollenhovia emeryi]|uniref:zinc finger CCCH domain-containing protein 13-like isoform X2 n=1 Tax=Vollenhovia emeryi TaxID=411798 RepID=UPI0005F4E6B1|nr:PREDICTED: zinc finger CCCH domain-containing protein 13-like isoform X2 [Vollenhovia emeryi]
MSRQLRGERDHVSRDYQEGYLGDFRDLRDLRDFRDFHRDTLDERDGEGLRERPATGRTTYRDDYPEEYDHRPTAASTSANLTNNPGKLNGRVTLHESRNDLQLVNLCVPTRSAIVCT